MKKLTNLVVRDTDCSNKAVKKAQKEVSQY